MIVRLDPVPPKKNPDMIDPISFFRQKAQFSFFFMMVENLNISSATCDDGASDAFLQMFLAKRMEQLQAVKNILLLGNHEMRICIV